MEHALAGDGGKRIRMKDPETGSFEWVGGAAACDIRQFMGTRVGHLREEMRQQGLHIQRADCPVQIGDESRSVDVCLWSSPHGGNALVEVKWTRGGMDSTLAWGSTFLPMLGRACKKGIWIRGGKQVKASVVGVLVVRPNDWCCTLSDVSGARSMQFPSVETQATKRRSGRSRSGAQKRKTNRDLKAKDKEWRKTAGKAMTRRHACEYKGRSSKAKQRRAKAERIRRKSRSNKKKKKVR